ncbi:hypothetical protein [Streptomyces sp. ODS25]|uniref:hypothetical protein n=1 Tax=Streptomyces odontomachi TaxID=2944940 RepID=UPI00272DDD37
MPDRSLRLHPQPSGPFASGPLDESHAAPLPRTHRPALPDPRPHDWGAERGRAATGESPGVQWATRDTQRVHGPGGSPGAQRGPAVRGRRGSAESDGSSESHGPDEPTEPRDGRDARRPGGRTDDNPYAPPPEGAADQPWRPRHRFGDRGSDSGDRGGRPSPWDQWSDRQPGRSQGNGFGDRPRGQGGPEGPMGPGGGIRWDPSDPAQRRAMYALLCGPWAFFFALFGWRDLALLLGALALYWSISSLRTKPRRPDPTAPQPAGASGAGAGARSVSGAGSGPDTGAEPGSGSASGGATGAGAAAKPLTSVAVGGLVMAMLALAMVATTFAAQLIYSDYYTCVDDALTTSAQHSCKHLLPENLRTILSTEP